MKSVIKNDKVDVVLIVGNLKSTKKKLDRIKTPKKIQMRFFFFTC